MGSIIMIILLLLFAFAAPSIAEAFFAIPAVLVVVSFIGGIILAFIIKFLYNLSNANGSGIDISSFKTFIKLVIGCSIAVFIVIIIFFA